MYKLKKAESQTFISDVTTTATTTTKILEKEYLRGSSQYLWFLEPKQGIPARERGAEYLPGSYHTSAKGLYNFCSM